VIQKRQCLVCQSPIHATSWTLPLPMPPKARVMNPPRMTITNKKVTHTKNLCQYQEEDSPFPMDDDQSSPQEAGPSHANRNHCTISALQVTDEESCGDVQAIMAKIAMLEDQNRKLALSKSTSKQIVFALLTIQSLRTCEKRERRFQGQLQQCPPATNDSQDPSPSWSPWAHHQG